MNQISILLMVTSTRGETYTPRRKGQTSALMLGSTPCIRKQSSVNEPTLYMDSWEEKEKEDGKVFCC